MRTPATMVLGIRQCAARAGRINRISALPSRYRYMACIHQTAQHLPSGLTSLDHQRDMDRSRHTSGSRAPKRRVLDIGRGNGVDCTRTILHRARADGNPNDSRPHAGDGNRVRPSGTAGAPLPAPGGVSFERTAKHAGFHTFVTSGRRSTWSGPPDCSARIPAPLDPQATSGSLGTKPLGYPMPTPASRYRQPPTTKRRSLCRSSPATESSRSPRGPTVSA